MRTTSLKQNKKQFLPGLSMNRADRNTAVSQSLSGRAHFQSVKLLPEGQDDGDPPQTPGRLMGASSGLPQVASISLGRVCAHVSCSSSCGCHPGEAPLDCLWQMAELLFLGPTGLQQVRKQFFISCLPELSTDGTDGSVCLPVFLGRGLFAYLKSHCLSIWLPVICISVLTGILSHWDTDRSCHSLSYWEPPRTKKVVWTVNRGLKMNQELGPG